MNHIPSTILAVLLTAAAGRVDGRAAPPVVCIALPKAQLGQGNNSPVDVSEPVRTMLGQYMAGPSVQLVRLDARIAMQIEAEATEKGCDYILQTSLVQKKKGTGEHVPQARAARERAADARWRFRHGRQDMGGMVAAQAVSSAAAQGAQQDYMPRCPARSSPT